MAPKPIFFELKKCIKRAYNKGIEKNTKQKTAVREQKNK